MVSIVDLLSKEMSVYCVYLLTSLLLMPIELVLSDILCKDSRIDAITYANDLQMYFITSGGYYWWLKEKDFPPSDSLAKRLPSPFTMGQAAVYVDSDSGCASSSGKESPSKVEGIKANAKEIWVEEYIGNEHKLLAFDTKQGVWRDQTVVYNKDHCISRARIDWAIGKPLDAMFVRNYLEIYFVQEDSYAMVDCNFICKDPNNFGEDKPQYKTTDFHTVDPIYAMFVKQNRVLYMFHKNTFYEMSIQPNSRNGRVVTIKGTQEKDIIRDFMKIASPGQCIEKTTPSVPDTKPPSGQKPTPDKDGPQNGGKPPSDGGSQSDGKENNSNGGGGGSGWALFLIIAIVFVVIGVAALVIYFVMKPKSGTGVEDDKEKAEKEKPSAVSPKPQELKGGVPSKAGTTSKVSAPSKASGLGAKKPTSALDQSKPSSMVTNKSNIDVIGMASKSDSTKPSTKK